MEAKNVLILTAGSLLIFAAWRSMQTEDMPTEVDESSWWDWQSGSVDEPEQETNFLEDAVNTITNAISGNNIASVVEAGPGYLVVTRPDGTTAKLKGSRNWRNNNPGNIEYGSYSKSMGAVGTDGRFAVFPTYAAGRRAKEALIFEGRNYVGLNLSAAIRRYAPETENVVEWYQKTVLAAVGGVDKPMNTYSAGERQAIMNAMEKVEGFKPGSVTVLA